MILDDSLRTARLAVRPFRDADAARLVEIFSDPQVARFVGDGSSLSLAQARNWVETSRANLREHGYGTGAVVRPPGETVLGWAGIARPPGQPQEIIYGLDRAYWGQGYGRELAAALADFAEARGLDPVRATVDRANAISGRILRDCGFHVAESWKEDGVLVDLYLRHGRRSPLAAPARGL
ncbi:GNAT family N-acetyltransferase [Histidinibacterium aquaticum]|nr:GNAT family N-acetyltransferase [Histidinibacterium aquaticum]